MSPPESKELVSIAADGVALEGMLEIPANACGVVLFAHGSGSSRLSPRNNHVATVLRQAGLGTLLLDLLTVAEDRTYDTRFDISLLAHRLATALTWLRQAGGELATLPTGLFGASTGAAAALRVAATLPQWVRAVVSRGGRPDLAGLSTLERVQAPTLLLVGGNDDTVIALNRIAYGHMRCEKQLRIVPDATHLFEEPGTLESVAMQAADWFLHYLAMPKS
ncbi:alpha/beta family hydrolase [Janthinobacterium sp. 17J80-10]|uniref:dienelactone hydrolase family protein n=1 Tax=Janthinobacterium sp. 17J80-10 TaxID=2497863 RepID=UPI0010055CBD|nr:alpha/beta family hydrolase [Janthinobacterium sp. 17J80-10]QAU35414.1 alpha/beta hydrolase [Janthinobacterium sp. 17J80-10]